MTSAHVLLVILAVAALWDLVVIFRYGISSGRTVSWLLYNDSRAWPALAFIAGYGCHWATSGFEVVAVFMFVAGHIFGTMKGA